MKRNFIIVVCHLTGYHVIEKRKGVGGGRLEGAWRPSEQADGARAFRNVSQGIEASVELA